MPRVNPEIIVWARETAGFTQEQAARKLGFQDSRRSSAAEKLASIEYGENEPSRPQLVKMAKQYRRPLLTFYLSKTTQTRRAGHRLSNVIRRSSGRRRGLAGRLSSRHKGASEHDSSRPRG